MSVFEMRANIKFLIKLNWKAPQIIEALQTVYGDHTLSKTAVYEWIKRFKDGRESLEDDSRSGRPVSSKSDQNLKSVEKLVEENRRITVEEVAATLGISHGSAHEILTDNLGLSKLSARWVPKALGENQLNQRADLSSVILSRIELNESQFFERIVTGDETWIYLYDPESKIQSKEWHPRGSSGPIKFKAERTVSKVMATIFWDSEGVILIDFLEGQKTVTSAYYEAVLKKLKSALIKKRSGKLHAGILFHHDNAPAHTSRAVRALLSEFRWEILPHPPYSPDLAPSDFFLFPNLKNHLKGTRFSSLDDAKNATKTYLRGQGPEFYSNGLMRWKYRLNKCIDANGSYIEKS